mmetsp:Transcript_30694/g.83120  ORF Transcript_30694/g.83120 Transcript_30694/m.83120 type:complete len:239 (-) Transcript_30694:344-1060(-)
MIGSVMGMPPTPITSCLAASTDRGPHAVKTSAISLIILCASSTESTTSLIIPQCFAFSADMFSAEAIMRLAWPVPIFETTYGAMKAGTRPTFTSVKVKKAVRSAMPMSQQHTQPTPSPMAEPFTRASVNWGRVIQLCHIFIFRRRPIFALPSGKAPALSAAFLRSSMCFHTCGCGGALARMVSGSVSGSAPPQKSEPVPEKMTRRWSGRQCRLKSASMRPTSTPSFMRLLASGLLMFT